MKAGAISCGEYQTEESIKKGQARIAVVATDASANTKKKMHNMCDFRNVPCYEYGTKEELGHCIGKEQRSSLTVNNEGLAKKLETQLTL